jgi:hypothetical protein
MKSGEHSPFYQLKKTLRSAKVHNVVVSWIEHVPKDLACLAAPTASSNLLESVKRGLLVVKLPGPSGPALSNNALLSDGMRTEIHLGNELEGR